MKCKLTFKRFENRLQVVRTHEFDIDSDKSAQERVRDIANRQRSFFFEFVKLEKDENGNWMEMKMPSHLLR